MQTLKQGSKGDDVRLLQKHLNLAQDGIFGKITEEAVKAFQTAKGLKPDGIVGEKTWSMILKLQPADYIAGSLYMGDLAIPKTSRPIKRIILHCSATPEGKDYTVADITRWHKERGYATIGYHFVIYRDGRIMTGRDINQIGAHCQGYNTGSIGICYIGGMDAANKSAKDTRTPEQRTSLRTLVAQLKRMYPNATVHGHNEFSSKACPSFNVQKDL